jgi:hypothetical protein
LAKDEATTQAAAATSAKAGYFNLANFLDMVLSRAQPMLLVNSSPGSVSILGRKSNKRDRRSQ